MATPEENMTAAQKRADDNRKLAEEARASGNLDKASMYDQRASTWDASVDRYKRIIDAKSRIETAKENIQEIQKRIDAIKAGKQTDEVTSGPNKGWYQVVTSRPSASCPSGHERVRITYMDGVETSSESLGCIGKIEKNPNIPNPDPAPTSATPRTTPPPPPPPPPPPAKTAPIDTILFEDDSVPIDTMFDLIFEDIGGHELINIARNDTITGQNIVYSPIKNITTLYQEYNPNNIVALQYTSDKYFANYPIKLETKIPEVGNGSNGVNYYIDSDTGDLVIETINMLPDEQVEVQITSGGTIYEVEL